MRYQSFALSLSKGFDQLNPNGNKLNPGKEKPYPDGN